MNQTLKVTVDAIKHERGKDGEALTVLHLELPNNTDMKHLQKAHRLSKKRESREIVTFTLRVYGGGDKRTWNVTSKGSKSKDFKTVAVIEVYFNESARFERYFNDANSGAYDVELTVDIQALMTPSPLFPPNDDDNDDNGVKA